MVINISLKQRNRKHNLDKNVDVTLTKSNNLHSKKVALTLENKEMR